MEGYFYYKVLQKLLYIMILLFFY